MTDSALTILAAKAAGIEDIAPLFDHIRYFVRPGFEFEPWFPLDDDGDALRLAVALGINIYLAENGFVTAGRIGIQGHRVALGNDPNAAARRSIVLAAAEIGKAMA